MPSEARKRANAKYDKGHTKGIYLKLNLKTDKDIIEQLETVDSKQGYIKDLIRCDISNTIGRNVKLMSDV